MHRASLFAFLCAALMHAQLASAGDKKNAEPAWPGVFPAIAGYIPTFRPPIVDKEKKQAVYAQSALYNWTGGRIEAIEVTLARNPAFEMNYAAERMKLQKPPPEAVKIGKHAGWLWKKGELVVILSKDRVLRLESRTEKFHNSDLPGFAGRFDLAKCAAALDRPPPTKSAR